MELKKVTVTVVGDGEVGKTCMVKSFIGEEIEGKYIPTVLEKVSRTVGGYEFVINDTAGQEEYSRLRTLAYPNTNVFVVCFALNQATSFKNIKTIWYPEVHHHRPNAPLILVGTKLDLGDRKVTEEEAKKMQKEINAVSYSECSAITGTNVPSVFQDAAKAYFKYGNKSRKRNNCSLL